MYTLWASLAVVVAIGIELAWLRTGIFRQRTFWLTLAVTWAFQVPVDGWLTKRSAPIVIYNHREISGVRFPWDIPVEDFAYGFALVTVVVALWVANGRREATIGS